MIKPALHVPVRWVTQSQVWAGPEFSIAEGYFFIIDICIHLLRTFLYHRHLYKIYNLYYGHLYITKNRHPLLVCKNITSRFSGINFENVV